MSMSSPSLAAHARGRRTLVIGTASLRQTDNRLRCGRIEKGLCENASGIFRRPRTVLRSWMVSQCANAGHSVRRTAHRASRQPANFECVTRPLGAIVRVCILKNSTWPMGKTKQANPYLRSCRLAQMGKLLDADPPDRQNADLLKCSFAEVFGCGLADLLQY